MPTKPPLVVCVDDDESILAIVARCLKREAFELRSTRSASEALSWITADEVAVLVSGAQLAGHARRVRPETVRILLTSKRTLETTIDGIHPGEIFKFLDKPFDSDVLRQTVRAAVERNRELLAMSGDRERRERREALRSALEAEYPGISQVDRRADEAYVVTSDPWSDAAELGLAGLTVGLENRS